MNIKTFYPPYLIARIADWHFQKKFPDTPWMCESACFVLDGWLKESDKVFEWGCGRSTLWIQERVSELHSIEHHKGWYEQVKNKIEKGSDRGAEVTLHFCDIDSSDYPDKINIFADDYFDVVIIDGRRRLECFKNALSKIRPGGLLVLDNSGRYVPNIYLGTKGTIYDHSDKPAEGWEEVYGKISSWRQFYTTNKVSDTTFWVKPC